MFDWLRKVLSRSASERKLVRHTALAFRGFEIQFIATEVVEADFRQKLKGQKGELLLRAKLDGQVAAICKSCRVPLEVVQKDQRALSQRARLGTSPNLSTNHPMFRRLQRLHQSRA